MTRETKIGLLVGLAFIIVIGILLSDNLTRSTEPPQATLAGEGNTVRSAVAAPGASNNPPILNTVTPTAVSPRQTVPTPTDLAPKVQPVQPVQVAVGGPTALQAPAQRTAPAFADDSAPTITKAPQIPASPEQTQVATADNRNEGASDLRSAAKQQGEEIIDVGGTQTNPVKSVVASNGMKQYPAVEGDSVSKMATKFFGSNTRANRDAIINANPTLKQDPNKLLVGHTYNIPASTGGATSVALSSPAPTATPTPAQSAQPTPAPAQASSDTWYTVKEGDSLWKIATEQCGSANAIATIREMNKDTLKGDTVVLNMKLRLPNKVASAN
ncbi:MAG TPA: LysM peptidoglycan-binding domain-containing protein [Tepidisphaeraceae bacterium]|jgi:nucleoid-associated protein YgaU|nr:LysM peptidoglycan-binding domain-containing protein [Tepidisphaeraceae bacterium]